VRFTGMVQNILDNEYITSVVAGKEIASGTYICSLCVGKKILVPIKYSDSLEFPGVEIAEEDKNFENSMSEERGKLICTPVPCENSWVKEAMKISNLALKDSRLISYVSLQIYGIRFMMALQRI
jgi:hypothetical protein